MTDKFRELVLYIAEQCERWPLFNYTKLNKILFYVDFEAYVRWAHSVTGQDYQKLQFGPAPRDMEDLIKSLTETQEAVMTHRRVIDYTQQRLVALRSPDLSVFTGPEMALIDQVLREVEPETADAISSRSHGHVGWMAAQMKETIPYGTALISRRPPTPEEIAYGQKLARDLNLQAP